LRAVSAALLCWMFVLTPVTAQTESDKARSDKTVADKAAADKAAAAKQAEDQRNQDAKVGIDNSTIYQSSGTALTILFVIAVMLESAFAVIFNWRVFLAYFSVRGVKTILMIVFSFAVVYTFGLDVLANLIAAYKSPAGGPPVNPADVTGFISKFITAMILAGGSAGVNRVMNALGIRNDRKAEDVNPKPPSRKAWIAVRISGQATQAKNIQVRIREIPADQVQNPPPDPIAGVIGLKRAQLSGLLFRDVNRFPENGGYTVTSGAVYQITVVAQDANDAPLRALGQKYAFAEGAIVDFEIREFEAV